MVPQTDTPPHTHTNTHTHGGQTYNTPLFVWGLINMSEQTMLADCSQKLNCIKFYAYHKNINHTNDKNYDKVQTQASNRKYVKLNTGELTSNSKHNNVTNK